MGIPSSKLFVASPSDDAYGSEVRNCSSCNVAGRGGVDRRWHHIRRRCSTLVRACAVVSQVFVRPPQ